MALFFGTIQSVCSGRFRKFVSHIHRWVLQELNQLPRCSLIPNYITNQLQPIKFDEPFLCKPRFCISFH